MTVCTPLVIGLGSPHGDDQAGWLVIAELQHRGWDHASARSLAQPIDLIDCLPTERPILLIDAASGPIAGTRRIWTWPQDTLPRRKRGGTHDLSLPDVLLYARQLSLLSAETTVRLDTLDGLTWNPFTEPCQAIRDAAVSLAEQLDREFPHA